MTSSRRGRCWFHAVWLSAISATAKGAQAAKIPWTSHFLRINFHWVGGRTILDTQLANQHCFKRACFAFMLHALGWSGKILLKAVSLKLEGVVEGVQVCLCGVKPEGWALGDTGPRQCTLKTDPKHASRGRNLQSTISCLARIRENGRAGESSLLPAGTEFVPFSGCALAFVYLWKAKATFLSQGLTNHILSKDSSKI